MSIMRCTKCERLFDSDYEEGDIIEEEWACDYCYVEYLEKGNIMKLKKIFTELMWFGLFMLITWVMAIAFINMI